MNEIVRREPAPAQGFGDTLMKVLSDPNISAEKLQIVLREQREILADLRRERFQTAFAAMHAKMPQITKEGLVDLGSGKGRYRYAKLENMDEAIRPILEQYGFALTFIQLRDGKGGGNVVVRGELLHVDGHSVWSEREMPPDTGPGRNSLQAIGSSISYARRYLTEGLLNIVRRGVDDDGKSAVSKPITAEKVKELLTLLKAIKTQPDTFLRLFVTGAEKMDEIQERDYPRLINALREKQRAMKGDDK